MFRPQGGSAGLNTRRGRSCKRRERRRLPGLPVGLLSVTHPSQTRWEARLNFFGRPYWKSCHRRFAAASPLAFSTCGGVGAIGETLRLGGALQRSRSPLPGLKAQSSPLWSISKRGLKRGCSPVFVWTPSDICPFPYCGMGVVPPPPGCEATANATLRRERESPVRPVASSLNIPCFCLSSATGTLSKVGSVCVSGGRVDGPPTEKTRSWTPPPNHR